MTREELNALESKVKRGREIANKLSQLNNGITQLQRGAWSVIRIDSKDVSGDEIAISLKGSEMVTLLQLAAGNLTKELEAL